MSRNEQVNIRRFLFIYRKMIPSIRLIDMLFSELERQKEIDYRCIQEMRITNKDLNWADAIVIGRFDSWYESKLAQRMQKADDFLIYYIDDDLINIPASIKSSIYYGRGDIKRYMKNAMESSRAILAPSPALLNKYAIKGRIPIQFSGAAVSSIQYQPHDKEAQINIGFSGSLDRASDLEEILKEALLTIKEKYGQRIRFAFFGAMPDYADQLDALIIPYEPDYEKYREKMNSLNWDIGLAPMPVTEFHACKFYNKFLEYAASAVAGIYSDCPPYDRIPEREKMGRFCQNNTESWVKAISDEIENYEEREKHRRNSNACAREIYNIKNVSSYLLKELRTVLLQHESFRERITVKRRALFFLKLGNIYFRSIGFIRQHGRNAPSQIWEKIRAGF